MAILGLDPGLQTGLALLKDNGSIIFMATESIEDVHIAIKMVVAYERPRLIAVETPPANIKSTDNFWTEIDGYLQNIFHNDVPPIERVAPGEWKPLSNLFKHKLERFKTDHAKDAVYIARYVLRKTSGRKS